ncbi:AP-1 complex subunit gamma-1 [Tritrichomonas musculus]|uniref:AP-1 complex subunit gamma n=1 Tax=Tritrichomonas musculus TaxID=1915356 RepID=A0ABR2JL49_9EUKA
MKSSYQDFVDSVEGASSYEKKSSIRGSELAKIRNRIKLADCPGRPRIVAKLIYLEMEGENTSFGQIEIVSLMANPYYPYKWIGYIGAGVLTDSNSDMAILMIQTITRDIENKKNPKIQILGLSAVANIGGSQLITAAIPSIQKALTSKYMSVVKCAASAALRSVRECPEFFETFRKDVPKLLNFKDHSVILSAVNLALEMLDKVPSVREKWKGFTRPFIDLLSDLKHNPPTKETEYHLFNDPFLQCRALRALGKIHSRCNELDGILQEIITDLDCHSNTGRSILIEATETIKKVAKSQSLKTLAINQIGRLLELKNSAVIYSALSAFSKLLLTSNNNDNADNSTNGALMMIDRTSADSVAMQRYRSQIVRCLDHPDISIRRRALDVVSAIINEDNVTKLVPEVFQFMQLVDNDFRGEIIPKLYAAIQRFSPDDAWNIDSTLHIIIDNPLFIGNDIITSYCSILADKPELRYVALDSIENVLSFYPTNQPLLQIASFSIGEYEARQENISDAIKSFNEVITSQPKLNGRTISSILVCLAKLAFKGGKVNEVTKIITKYARDNRLDVQQRAGEMIRLLTSSSNLSYILAPMNEEDAAEQAQNHIDNDDQDSIQNQTSSSLINLNDNYDEGGEDKKETLLDLLDSDIPTNSSTQMKKKLPNGAFLAFEQDEFAAYFEVQKNPKNQREVAIRVSYYNKSQIQLNKFNVAFAVSGNWKFSSQPPSGNVLPPAGGSPITQILFLSNNGNSGSQLSMKAQVSYLFRSQPITEICQVNTVI